MCRRTHTFAKGGDMRQDKKMARICVTFSLATWATFFFCIFLKVSTILLHLTYGVNPTMKLAESAGFRGFTSQSSRSYLRQNTYGRRDQFLGGIDREV
jgi:hypothetical protein